MSSDRNEADQHGHSGALFGRRHGHKLSPAKRGRLDTLLPTLRVPAGPLDDLKALFARPVSEVWLEIGFGGGEHLVLQAERHPHIGLIGCEPFINGAAKALEAIEARGLDNIRIHDGDAVDLLQRLPPASLARAFLLYPDPWPKRRHNKRRFVSPERLDMLARALQPGAAFRFASDIDDYVAWTLRAVAASPDFAWPAEHADDWRLPYDGWQPTRYEQKAIREGRRSSYLRFTRR